MSKAVSVVIPCHNAAATVDRQISAVLTQLRPHDELVLVDNRSTDDLDGAVRPFMESGPPLRVVRADGHQGSSYARNRGIAAARAPYVMFCDADDVVWHHALRPRERPAPGRARPRRAPLGRTPVCRS